MKHTQRSQKTLAKKIKILTPLWVTLATTRCFYRFVIFSCDVRDNWLCAQYLLASLCSELYLLSQAVYPDITKFGLFYGQFLLRSNLPMNFVFQSCLSGSLLNHEIMLSKTFFISFFLFKFLLKFFTMYILKKGDNKVELSYP